MIISTKGIVFRSVKYSETSFITDIYTEAKGLQVFIISGVRKSKTTTGAGLFQPGSLVDIVAYYRDDKKMHRIKEAKLGFSFREIPFSIHKMAVSVFITELCSKTVKESEPNPVVFQFLWDSYVFLDETKESIANIPVSFMSKLTTFLGFKPQVSGGHTPIFDLSEGVFCESPKELEWSKDGITIPLMKTFFATNINDAHQISCKRTERIEIIETLTKYYSYHLQGFKKLNSPDIYGAIF